MDAQLGDDPNVHGHDLRERDSRVGFNQKSVCERALARTFARAKERKLLFYLNRDQIGCAHYACCPFQQFFFRIAACEVATFQMTQHDPATIK